MIAGCGDNNIYIWDMCSGDVKCILKGHKDYIHCVDHLRKTNQVMSGSEDGTVKFWDVRTSEAVEQITPSSMEMACRNSLGKWISCVAVDSKEDWMVRKNLFFLSQIIFMEFLHSFANFEIVLYRMPVIIDEI